MPEGGYVQGWKIDHLPLVAYKANGGVETQRAE